MGVCGSCSDSPAEGERPRNDTQTRREYAQSTQGHSVTESFENAGQEAETHNQEPRKLHRRET